jgi:hypothetical protein
MSSCRSAWDFITSRNKNNDLNTYINQQSKYIFDTSGINTDDRSLCCTLQGSVRYSTYAMSIIFVPFFIINELNWEQEMTPIQLLYAC